MKRFAIITSLFIICTVNYLFAQKYTPVEQSSAIQFKVSHQMIFRSTVTGTFKGLKGGILFDPKNLAQSSFNVSVNVETINSGIGLRDHDLKEEKYFDVDKYPLITIRSQAITKGPNNDTYIFSGMLTMKGVTKTISFQFTAKPEKEGYGFIGNFHLNRLDYNVGPDNSIDKDVEVSISVYAK